MAHPKGYDSNGNPKIEKLGPSSSLLNPLNPKRIHRHLINKNNAPLSHRRKYKKKINISLQEIKDHSNGVGSGNPDELNLPDQLNVLFGGDSIDSLGPFDGLGPDDLGPLDDRFDGLGPDDLGPLDDRFDDLFDDPELDDPDPDDLGPDDRFDGVVPNPFTGHHPVFIGDILDNLLDLPFNGPLDNPDQLVELNQDDIGFLNYLI